MDGLAVREETPKNNREAEGEVLTHFLLHSFLSSFLGLKLLGLRIVPSLVSFPYPAAGRHSALSSDNSQIHLWLENAVWPILEL